MALVLGINLLLIVLLLVCLRLRKVLMARRNLLQREAGVFTVRGAGRRGLGRGEEGRGWGGGNGKLSCTGGVIDVYSGRGINRGNRATSTAAADGCGCK
jgi:hypothetical protein